MTPEYDAWNEALTSHFLQGQSGDPLYLYTDDAVLEELAPEVGVEARAAREHFIAAVRGTLGQAEPFRPWWAVSSKHLSAGEPPRWLAVLCLLVLVAVERETTRFQYYPDLNGYLGRDGREAPPGFDLHVPQLFQRFNEWLEGPGTAHGLVTAKPHDAYPNIGWVLSQALVRPTDRALLLRLMHAARIPASPDRDGAWLRAQMLPRLRTGAESTSRTRLLSLNDSHSALLEDVLEQEHAAWDGSGTGRVGPEHLTLRLCFEETTGEWFFLSPYVEGAQGSTWRVGSSSGEFPRFKGFEATPAEIWDLVGRGEVGRVTDGPSLRSRTALRRWLVSDPRAGAWAEVGRRDESREHLVIVSRSDAESLLLVPGVRHDDDLPGGLRLLRVPPGVPLAEASEALEGHGQTLPRLEGGLVLDARTSTYLSVASGLPAVAEAVGTVSVDGTPVAVIDGGASLEGLSLGDGPHEVRVGERRLSLRLVSRLQEGPLASDGTPCWIDDLPLSDHLAVPWTSGTLWMIGEHGEAEERPAPALTWLAGLDLPIAEVTVTSMVSSTSFAPSYVVATDYMGKPWVEPVPLGLARVASGEATRQLSTPSARELVTALLSDYRPAERRSDRRWLRALASFLRTAHR